MLQVSFSKIAHFERTKTSMIFVFNVYLLWAIYLGMPAAGSKLLAALLFVVAGNSLPCAVWLAWISKPSPCSAPSFPTS
jgi:hypothetical protein